MRVKQCLILAESSGCPRRKFGAMLIDPDRNVVLSDGYNGGPRGSTEGSMCRGFWCEREGLSPEQVKVSSFTKREISFPRGPELEVEYWTLTINGTKVSEVRKSEEGSKDSIEELRDRALKDYPKIESGKQMEKGCHHAESNVICNAAANGVAARGAWLIVTGEPCLMCAKLIHHAGVERVICVENGYKGGKAGPEYLIRNGVSVCYTDGPKDPRS